MILYNIGSHKIKVLDKIRFSTKDDSYFIKWKDSENIAYIKNIKGENILISRNIYTNNKSYKSLNKFDKIHGFSFNSNQNLIAISASVNNQSDIYLLSANSSNLKKITDDESHDIHPSFLKNSTSIIFSSNRRQTKLDSINTFNDTNNFYNLFLYN